MKRVIEENILKELGDCSYTAQELAAKFQIDLARVYKIMRKFKEQGIVKITQAGTDYNYKPVLLFSIIDFKYKEHQRLV